MPNLPHPIPYQGSKRLLATAILGIVPRARQAERLFEPFAGSAAITIAAAHANLAHEFIIGDTLAPLVELWRSIICKPKKLAEAYSQIWFGQQEGDESYYAGVRRDFNQTNDPARLLYLLARCVKNSPRWNRENEFNQSEDKRRLGMHPTKMTREIFGAYHLLCGKAQAVVGDFEHVLKDAGPRDLVYLDPPWEGTSTGRDRRYHRGLERDRLIAVLSDLNRRKVPWLLSYDGRCGAKSYGSPLPADLRATRLELNAGRSSQATLNGVVAETVESLYVSESLTITASICRAPRQVSFLDPRLI